MSVLQSQTRRQRHWPGRTSPGFHWLSITPAPPPGTLSKLGIWPWPATLDRMANRDGVTSPAGRSGMETMMRFTGENRHGCGTAPGRTGRITPGTVVRALTMQLTAPPARSTCRSCRGSSIPFWKLNPNYTAFRVADRNLVWAGLTDQDRGLTIAYVCVEKSGRRVEDASASLRLPDGQYRVQFISPSNGKEVKSQDHASKGLQEDALPLPAFRLSPACPSRLTWTLASPNRAPA